MIKPVLTFAAVGFVGIVLWRLAAILLLPILFFVFKLLAIAGVILFAFWLFKRQSTKGDDPAPAE
jgi:hypothetical protein